MGFFERTLKLKNIEITLLLQKRAVFLTKV